MSAIDASSLNFWETVADVGTWFVIIGVAGEGLEILLKLRRHKSKNEKFLTWYAKHDFAIEIIGGICWLMVVVGLGIEFEGNHKSQQIVKNENTRITKEAGKAIGLAGDANERAANALKQAGESNERASKFDADRALIAKQAEEIRATNLVLQAKLAEVVAQVNAVNPMKKPAFNVTAMVSLKNTGDLFSNPEVTNRLFAGMTFRVKRPNGRFSAISMFSTGKFIRRGGGTVVMEFVWDRPADMLILGQEPNPIVEDLLESLFECTLTFRSDDLKVGGSKTPLSGEGSVVDFVVNNGIGKRFSLHPPFATRGQNSVQIKGTPANEVSFMVNRPP